MIFKKKEFFLLIFLIFLQSCSGGRIGNFLESSFNDLDKPSQNQDLQNNLVNKNIVEKEKTEIDDKKSSFFLKNIFFLTFLFPCSFFITNLCFF